MNSTAQASGTTHPSADRQSAPITPGRVVIGSLSALVVNLAIFAIATSAGVSFDMASSQPTNAYVVAAASLLPIVIGAAVVTLVARRRPGFRRFASWAGLAFAIVTCAGSFGASGDVPTALALSAMHVVVGLTWFLTVKPSGRG